jgi:hypothetical protein
MRFTLKDSEGTDSYLDFWWDDSVAATQDNSFTGPVSAARINYAEVINYIEFSYNSCYCLYTQTDYIVPYDN